MAKSELFVLVFYIVLPIFCLLFLFFIPNFYTDFFGEPSATTLYCLPGKFWGGQSCVNCSQVEHGFCNCSTYQGCDEYFCDPRYMKIGNTQCQSCPEGCIVCGMIDNAVQCLACDLNYQIIGNICVEKQNCSEFQNTTGICNECVNGTYQDTSSIQNQSLPDYYNYLSTQCTTCNINNCQTCLSSTICQQCNDGYQWSNDQCQQCIIDNCQTCTNGIQSCTQCISGYYLYNQTNCTPCGLAITNCSTCLNSTQGLICETCQNNYTLINNNILQNVCEDCQTFTFENKTIISNQGCTSCLGPNNCLTCEPNYVLYKKRCFICPEGCDFLSGGCTYNNPGYGAVVCTACFPGYYLNKIMYSNYLVYYNCLLCNQTNEHWLQCSDSKTPTQCRENYFLFSNSSGSYCVNGIINNTTNISYCQTVEDESSCSSCLYEYSVGPPLCNPCSTGCNQCSYIDSSVVCSSCQQGYYLNNQECSFCSNGCQNCSNIQTCTLCLNGYYLDQGTCSQCFLGCGICIDSISCQQCQLGYYSIINNNIITSCSQCEANCQNCTSSTCTVCNEGFLLQNGQCISLESANCFNSNSAGCINCQYGYYLSNQSCLQCIDPSNNFVCRKNEFNNLPSVTLGG